MADQNPQSTAPSGGQVAAIPPLERRWVRVSCLLAGIILPQVIQYGSALVGTRILLPLEILALPRFYLPPTQQYLQLLDDANFVNSDMVLSYEPVRQFVVSEMNAGRFPTWWPQNHGGTPFASYPVISPFTLLHCALDDPISLAWVQLLKAMIAGIGTFLFFRYGLGVGFWPAAVCAWAFPLCGYLVFWQGFLVSNSAVWLPWMLLATDRIVRRPTGFRALGLSVVVALSLISGTAPDPAAQSLLASGLYAIYLQVQLRGAKLPPALFPGSLVVAGWVMGFTLACCQILPLYAFSQLGARVQERGGGKEERPPVGLQALPQVVLPFFYGSHAHLSTRASYIAPLVLPESSAAGYAGLLAVFIACPLAFMERGARRAAVFWIVLGFLGLSWQLNVPLLTSLWRLPGLNLCSHNRFVLLTAFSVLAIAALGLDALSRNFIWRRGFLIPIALLGVLALWSFIRSIDPPSPLAENLQVVSKFPENHPERLNWIRGVGEFSSLSTWGAAICLAGLGWWLLIYFRRDLRTLAFVLLAGGMVVEPLANGWNYNTQSSPELYYPLTPNLEQLRLKCDDQSRMLGVGCLPPSLSNVLHLSDVRGYDSVDPARYVKLLLTSANPDQQSPPYARTQWLVPRIGKSNNKLTVPPVLNLLGVRYLVFPPDPRYSRTIDYIIVENADACPRAFVPLQVKAAPSDDELLKQLAGDTFNPRAVAYVEGAGELGPCQGNARIISDIPGRVEVEVQTDSPGVLLLADGWYAGWQAQVNGQATPVHRADYALRAVDIPAGTSLVIFEYHSPAVLLGFRISLVALVVSLLYLAVIAWMHWKGPSSKAIVPGSLNS